MARYNHHKFLRTLATTLLPMYTPPKCLGGHTWLHVKSMISLYSPIARNMRAEKKPIYSEEYIAACWLHNIDRVEEARQEIQDLAPHGLRKLCMRYLHRSPFTSEEQSMIADAVVQHSKKDDDLIHDSPLLTALRIADKVVRFSAEGITAMSAHLGSKLLPYNPEHPFGYGETSSERLRTLYADFFRTLEWYGMLPYDWARVLISHQDRALYLHFLRSFGRTIAEQCQVENTVEDDIRRALGVYYDEFTKQETT